MESTVNRIHILFEQFYRNIKSEMNLDDLGITKPQMYLMFTVKRFGKCKLSLLAEKMEVRPSAVTVMIDRLEKLEYVLRTQDPTDRRALFVEITPQGQFVLDRAVQERNRVMDAHLSRLTQGEIVLFANLMEKLVNKNGV